MDIQVNHVDAAIKSLETEEELKASLDRLKSRLLAVGKENIILLGMVGEVLHHYRELNATDPEAAYQITRKAAHQVVDENIEEIIDRNRWSIFHRLRHTQGTAPAIKDVVDHSLKLYRESL